MGLLSILRFIANHPLNKDHKTAAILRFIRWQINVRLNPYPIIYQFTDKALLVVKKGMPGATGNLYCGLHEFEDMGFLLHFLRKEDLFMDIGANIGSYTVLSAAHVGAQTISAEPVPSTFSHLKRNIGVNGANGLVRALNVAIGAQKSYVEITTTMDAMNRVATIEDKDKVRVELTSLDEILSGLQTPALIKIDVEGFEAEVIKGAKNILANNQLKAIIIELNSFGKRYGYGDPKTHGILLDAGFEPYLYDPMKRALTKTDTYGFYNTIYIRDIAFATKRVQTAEKFVVLKKAI